MSPLSNFASSDTTSPIQLSGYKSRLVFVVLISLYNCNRVDSFAMILNEVFLTILISTRVIVLLSRYEFQLRECEHKRSSSLNSEVLRLRGKCSFIYTWGGHML